MMRERLIRLLRWSERYTKTDMVYLASGGFWLTIELIAAAAFSLGVAVVFGHYASKDLYGNYKYILSITSLITAFSLSGIGTALTQATARGNEGALTQGFALNLRWSMPVSVIALGVGGYYYLNGNLFVALSMCVVAVASPFLSSFSLFDNFLIGRKEFKRSAFYAIVGNLFSAAALIGALFIGERAIMLVIAYFAVNVATNAFFYVRAVRTVRNNQTDPDMFRYGFHLSVIGVVGSIANQIDSIAVFALLGPINLAIYTYAIAMPEQIKNLIKNIIPLSMPKFAERSITEIRATIWRRVTLLGVGIGVVALLYIALAPFLFRVLFPIYIGSVWYSQLYMVSLLLSFIAPLTTVFQAHKNTKELYIISNVPQFVLIITLPTLTMLYGIEGAIMSQIIYRATTAILAIILFQRMR